MLPWFVGLQDDLSTLEVAEAGTWEQLRDAHMSLSAGPASPSGLANRYGVILFRFPAAVEINELGALSNALVCRMPWDSPRVEQERDIVLGSDRAAAWQFIEAWRKKAVGAAIEAIQLVQAREREAFGDRSYFCNLETSLLYGTPLLELADEECQGPEEEDEQGQLDFAEQPEL